MIKTETQKSPSSILEQLRVTSETLSDEQVLKLFEGTATDFYNSNLRKQFKTFDLKDLNSDSAIDLLSKISKEFEVEEFDLQLLKELLEKSFELKLPNWAKSQEDFKKSKKITLLKKLKTAINKTYPDRKEIVSLFITLFDLNESDTPVVELTKILDFKGTHYLSVADFLEIRHHKGEQFIHFLDQLTKSIALLSKPIEVYYSLSTGELSLNSLDSNSFIVSELKLEFNNGTMNLLMSELRKEKSNPVEVIKKIIASGLKKKYLHLSKNSASFDSFKKGKVPFALVSNDEIKNNIQYKNSNELRDLRDLVPKSDLERLDSIIDEILGR